MKIKKMKEIAKKDYKEKLNGVKKIDKDINIIITECSRLQKENKLLNKENHALKILALREKITNHDARLKKLMELPEMSYSFAK
jgi:cell division septum initiation protein DivIVA